MSGLCWCRARNPIYFLYLFYFIYCYCLYSIDYIPVHVVDSGRSDASSFEQKEICALHNNLWKVWNFENIPKYQWQFSELKAIGKRMYDCFCWTLDEKLIAGANDKKDIYKQ